VSDKNKILMFSAIIGAVFLWLRFISSAFDYDTAWDQRPTYLLVTLMVISSLAFCGLLWSLSKSKASGRSFAILLGLGLVFRALWFGSTPIYEDDFYRYFWDGNLIVNGYSPYVTAPADALPSILPANIGDSPLEHSGIDPKLQAIQENGPVERVAYPYVKTIYPPIAQTFFATSQLTSPWNLDAWRMILLIFDGLSLWLLLRMVRRYKKPDWSVMIFWLNPLLITETMNAGHMDILLLPFLIGAVLLVLNDRSKIAALSLVGAVGVKLWPIILAPLLFANYLKAPIKHFKSIVSVTLILVVASLIILYPQLAARFEPDTGIAAYSANWQTNSFLFSYIDDTFATIFDDNEGTYARMLVFIAILGLIFFKSLKVDLSKPELLTKSLLIITASLFLLSPTGYPWYLIWMIPWLVLHPSPALLLLTVTLPLYDLRYPLSLDAESNLFDDLIVPIEFAPSVIWIAIDFMKSLKGKQSDRREAY